MPPEAPFAFFGSRLSEKKIKFLCSGKLWGCEAVAEPYLARLSSYVIGTHVQQHQSSKGRQSSVPPDAVCLKGLG